MKNLLAFLGTLALMAIIVGSFAFTEWLLTIDWINWILLPLSFTLIATGFWGAVKLLRGDFDA